MPATPRLDRRTFLRGVGAAVALPSLECMMPGSLRLAAQTGSLASPKRFMAVHVALGMYGPEFFPKETGAGYILPKLLQPLAKVKDDFTIFSGLEHPEVVGGHRGIVGFLTGVNVFGFPGYDYKNTVSLDQVYARHVGSETRFDSLQLATSGNSGSSSWDISWTPEGIAMQPISKPRDAFLKLFGANEDGNADARRREYIRRTSLLDRVMDQAKSLDRQLGKTDREKMDEYLTSVRTVERRIEKAEEWANIPKPEVDRDAPDFNSNADIDMFQNGTIMFELAALAFETDSTRSITLQIPSTGVVFNNLDGVTEGYHAVSHHGKEEAKIRQLLRIEEEHSKRLAWLIERLGNHDENGERLLDSTTILFGSGLGNASSHSNRRLPILLAGGGYKTHGQHIDVGENGPPLSNLYLSCLHHLGVPAQRFADSTRPLSIVA